MWIRARLTNCQLEIEHDRFKELRIKLRCDTRFQHAPTACGCVFKVITLLGSNQGNYFENAITCSKCTLKTLVTTQLYARLSDSYLYTGFMTTPSLGAI